MGAMDQEGRKTLDQGSGGPWTRKASTSLPIMPSLPTEVKQVTAFWTSVSSSRQWVHRDTGSPLGSWTGLSLPAWAGWVGPFCAARLVTAPAPRSGHRGWTGQFLSSSGSFATSRVGRDSVLLPPLWGATYATGAFQLLSWTLVQAGLWKDPSPGAPLLAQLPGELGPWAGFTWPPRWENWGTERGWLVVGIRTPLTMRSHCTTWVFHLFLNGRTEKLALRVGVCRSVIGSCRHPPRMQGDTEERHHSKQLGSIESLWPLTTCPPLVEASLVPLRCCLVFTIEFLPIFHWNTPWLFHFYTLL